MKYNPKILLSVFLFCTTAVLLPGSLKAQMFSIGDSPQQQPRGINFYTMIGASWEIADFSYAGDGATEFERVDFSDNILRFRLDSPGLDLSIAFGGDLTGMNENSYLNLSGRLYNGFPVTRSRSFVLLVPLQLSSDLKQVRQNRSDAEFLQSSLAMGTGLSTIFRIGERLSMDIAATPNYGFSFSQGSLFGGNLFRFDGKSLLHIHNVFGSHSLSFGYYFDYRQYSIEGNLNDYDYTSHSFTIGYSF